ncbi:uncharacterized protein PG986_010046 [Apiospora aurea]|uniref:Uncharacterized protein n=1 Tax=Apiospora aurea TaxID=335848 RepID=A0ABR1Q9E6_9PEZI
MVILYRVLYQVLPPLSQLPIEEPGILYGSGEVRTLRVRLEARRQGAIAQHEILANAKVHGYLIPRHVHDRKPIVEWHGINPHGENGRYICDYAHELEGTTSWSWATARRLASEWPEQLHGEARVTRQESQEGSGMPEILAVFTRFQVYTVKPVGMSADSDVSIVPQRSPELRCEVPQEMGFVAEVEYVDAPECLPHLWCHASWVLGDCDQYPWSRGEYHDRFTWSWHKLEPVPDCLVPWGRGCWKAPGIAALLERYRSRLAENHLQNQIDYLTGKRQLVSEGRVER